MTQYTFRFRVRHQVGPADSPDELTGPADAADAASWIDHDVRCRSQDSIFDALRAVDEAREGAAWGPILAGRGSPAIMLRPVQSTTASIILDGNTSMEGLRLYFGPWLDDPRLRFELESLDGVGNGAGPGGFSWEALASALELARFGLEFYGGFEFARQVVRHVQGKRASPAHKEAQAWVQFGAISRRLKRYLHGRDTWDTEYLQRVLGLEPFLLGKLLRQCGFETTPERPDRWNKVMGG